MSSALRGGSVTKRGVRFSNETRSGGSVMKGGVKKNEAGVQSATSIHTD